MDTAGTLYLVVARRSADGRIGNDEDGALYRSADGAEHWTRIALPAGVNGPRGLAVDPRDANGFTSQPGDAVFPTLRRVAAYICRTMAASPGARAGRETSIFTT